MDDSSKVMDLAYENSLTALTQSIIRKCPISVFLICGIFPLVPGAGILWTTYNLVVKQFPAALHSASSP